MGPKGRAHRDRRGEGARGSPGSRGTAGRDQQGDSGRDAGWKGSGWLAGRDAGWKGSGWLAGRDAGWRAKRYSGRYAGRDDGGISRRISVWGDESGWDSGLAGVARRRSGGEGGAAEGGKPHGGLGKGAAHQRGSRGTSRGGSRGGWGKGKGFGAEARLVLQSGAAAVVIVEELTA